MRRAATNSGRHNTAEISPSTVPNTVDARRKSADRGTDGNVRRRKLEQQSLVLLLIPSVVVLVWICFLAHTSASLSPAAGVVGEQSLLIRKGERNVESHQDDLPGRKPQETPTSKSVTSSKERSRSPSESNGKVVPDEESQSDTTNRDRSFMGEETNITTDQKHEDEAKTSDGGVSQLPEDKWSPPDASLLSSTAMVILVLSDRDHAEQRQLIRETWASVPTSAVYFLIGQRRRGCHDSEDECKEQGAALQPAYQERDSDLIEEQAAHGDLILVDRPESYHSLPHKLKFGYRWTIDASSSTLQWIVKVDDDMFVKPGLLQSFLQTLDSTQPTVVGRIETVHVVESSGKWADPKYKPKPDRVQPDGRLMYPRFPLGSCGHIVSRPVAKYVATHFDELSSDYQGEDTSLGIWLDEWAEVASSGNELVWVDLKRNVTSDGVCHLPEVLMAGHDLSARDIRICWNMLKYDEQHSKK